MQPVLVVQQHLGAQEQEQKGQSHQRCSLQLLILL